ncbi:MAG: hypothetical protein ACSLE3_14850, partial [Microbacteriaceae bacterium]
ETGLGRVGTNVLINGGTSASNAQQGLGQVGSDAQQGLGTVGTNVLINGGTAASNAQQNLGGFVGNILGD